MKSIIFGIVFVALLQFSFQVYMAVDRSDAEYRSMNAIDAVRRVPTPELATARLPEPETDPAAAVAHAVRMTVPRPEPRRDQVVTAAVKPAADRPLLFQP